MIVGLDLDSCPYCGSSKIIMDKFKRTLKCRHCKRKFSYETQRRPDLVTDGYMVYIFNEQRKQ